MPLTEPDEARYGNIAAYMSRTGDYVTPHLNHVVYWATALLFKIFGENEFSSRLFAALCAWGCVFLVYRIGTFFHDEKSGIYSAGVLSTFLFHSIIAKINILDMPLAFFVCLAIWAGYRYCHGGCEKKGWLYLFYAASGLAFLTKGLIGVVFPFAVTLLWLIISRRWRDGFKLLSPVGMALFLLISIPWIILVQKSNPDFLWFFFIREHLLRYTTTLHGRHQAIWFYIPIVVLGTLPWSAFVLKALKGKDMSAPFFKAGEKHLFLIWIFFIFIFFSISSSQLLPYIAPLFLPIAVILGHLFRSYEDRKINREEQRNWRLLYDLPILLQPLLFITFLLLPSFIKSVKVGKHLVNIRFEYDWRLVILPVLLQIMLVFLPGLVQRKWGKGWFQTITLLSALFLVSIHFPIADFLTSGKSAYPVSKAIHALVPGNEKLYQFDVCLYGIYFYDRIRTPIIGSTGEMRYGVEHLSPEERSRYFLSPGEFYRQCKDSPAIYCVTRHGKHIGELERRFSSLEVLWDDGHFCLLRLKS